MSTRAVDVKSICLPKETGSMTQDIVFSFLRGKGDLTSVKSKLSTPNPDTYDVIKDGDLLPGDTVSNQ